MKTPLHLHRYAAIVLLLLANLCATSQLAAQSTTFTYQGRLESSGATVNGFYDLRFALFNALTAGAQQGSTLTNLTTVVSNGLFTVSLDFGNQYPGADRWLEIGVRTNGSGSFTVLNPRQKLTSIPYAYRASQAGSATTATSASVASSVSAGVILNSSLATNAVTTDKIADGTVGMADLSAAVTGSTFWRLDGNAGTTPGTHFLGTTDNQSLEIKVNGQRAFRLEPRSGQTPNVIGGFNNSVHFTGGGGNTIGGGSTNNIADGGAQHNTIAGGDRNWISDSDGSTVGGGFTNTIFVSSSSVIGGGTDNHIETAGPGGALVIGGGRQNTILYGAYGTICGGQSNFIGPGSFATIAGGVLNEAAGFAFAAGRRAKAVYQGDFVWADSTDADFTATGYDQFLVRASGGVGINTNQPTAALHIGGTPGVDGIRFPDGTLQTSAAAVTGSTFWRLDGNAGTTAGTNFLGTTDNQPLEFKVNGQKAFRLEPRAGQPPNVIGGFNNSVSLTTAGGGNTIAGGTTNGISDGSSSYNMIGGGSLNSISDAGFATISGGWTNKIFHSSCSVIAGGYANVIGEGGTSTIGGGANNAMPYSSTYFGTIGGGQYNIVYPGAFGYGYGTVPGGLSNAASGFSFAAGRRAKAVYQGDFVWADSTDEDFQATGANQFLVRASGGVGINTNQPTAALHIGGSPGVDGIRFPDGSLQTSAAAAPAVLFTSGSGNNPATTNNFLSATITVTVTGPAQKILVTAHKAFGSTSAAGANNLDLYIGYRLTSSTGGPSVVGPGISGNRVVQNTRVTMGMSGVITGLAAGDYLVGLVGRSSNAANWNNNESSYVTAVVY